MIHLKTYLLSKVLKVCCSITQTGKRSFPVNCWATCLTLLIPAWFFKKEKIRENKKKHIAKKNCENDNEP